MYNEIKQNVASFTSEVSKRMSEKNEIAQVSSEIQRLQITLGNLNTEASSLGYVEKVELPDDFMSKMSEIEVGISAWNQYTSNIDSRNQKQLEKDLDDSINLNKKETLKIYNRTPEKTSY